MGFSLKEFYCCGKLQSVSFTLTANEKEKCNKGNSNNDGCCKDKYKDFKVKDTHINATHVSSDKHFVDLHLYTPLVNAHTFISQKATIAYKSNAPPVHAGVPVYLYNCVFRI